MAFSTTDTIVAIATPPGRGGIGVVRLSGSDARAIAGGLITHARPLEPRHATFTQVRTAPSYVVSGFPALSGCEGSRTVSDAEASSRTVNEAGSRTLTEVGIKNVTDVAADTGRVTGAIDHVVVT